MSFPISSTPSNLVFRPRQHALSAASHVFDQISRRMTGFIAEHFDIAPDAALARQRDFFMRYGTTLRGLMTETRLAPVHSSIMSTRSMFGTVDANPELA